MSEYTNRISDNQYIKIGTCGDMYYLRFDDIDKVQSPGYDLRKPGLRFRLPFHDEDGMLPGGDYDDYERGFRLYGFKYEPASVHPGRIQMRHESGISVSLNCYHGEAVLPDVPADSGVSFRWNAKDIHPWELAFVKTLEPSATDEEDSGSDLAPIIRCRHSRKMFRATWKPVIACVSEPIFKDRLIAYSNYKSN